MIGAALENDIKDFIKGRAEADRQPCVSPINPFWTALADRGTELWLDTGDMDAAASLWAADFTALTTNNTLLNAEIQKGIYDGLVSQARPLVDGLDPDQQVMEVSFILNAVHGLRLVHRFSARVSVELHTAIAHEVDRSEYYGKRFAELCDAFIVKVPLTPAGLVATRRLRQSGVPINFTLGFGARQNAVAAVFAKPDYVNVFLGRLNAYAENNGFQNSDFLGERAAWASQDFLRSTASSTRQIAASIRGADQLGSLAGMDVFTIPVGVARDAVEQLDGHWTAVQPDSSGIGPADSVVSKTCGITRLELEFAENLDDRPPASGDELVERAHAAGVGDLFPKLSDEDFETISADGKIPVHAKWATRMDSGELALDSLLSLAGLAAFAKDQEALDNRVRRLLDL